MKRRVVKYGHFNNACDESPEHFWVTLQDHLNSLKVSKVQDEGGWLCREVGPLACTYLHLWASILCVA